ncbi:MAG TPA: hypothetical protein VGG83_10745 [Trebonia sp.]|jgi:hypothetical protein
MPGESGFRVATAYVALGVDEAGIEDQLVEILQSACSAAGAAGGDVLVQQLASAASRGGDDIGAGLIEAVSGAGDAAGAELADGLLTSLDESAGRIAATGSELAGAFGEGLGEGDAGAGEQLLGQLQSALASGAGQIDALAGQMGHEAGDSFASAFASAERGGIAAAGAYAAGATGLLGSLLGRALGAKVGDAALEAGVEAGDALAAGIASSAAGAGARTAVKVAAGIEASLGDALVQAGAAAGDALTMGIGESAATGADGLAQKVGDAVQASLETTMTQAGMAAGDALNAGMAATATEGAAAVGADLAAATQGPAQEAGTEAGAAWGRGFGNAALAGVDLLEAGLSTAGVIMDPAARAKAAVDAIAAQEAEEIAAAFDADEAFLQRGIDEFTSMSGVALSEWLEQVQLASESGTAAFISVYSAIQAQLEATTALTDEQQAALDLMYFRARTEMDSLQAEAIAFNTSIRYLDFVPQTMTPAPMGGYSEEEFTSLLANANAARAAVNGVSEAEGVAAKGAESMGGSMGGLAEVMYGPLGMAAFGLMSVLPMLGGMFSSSAVSAADFTSAVSQDSNSVGDNTAATIQSTLAKTNLADISKTLGLSQAQLIEYASGEAQVQQQVTAAYTAKLAAMQSAAKSGPEAGRGTDIQVNQLEQQKAALDAIASSVAQAIGQDQAQSDALLAAEQSTQIYDASVAALGSQMLLQTEQTQMSNQATVEYGDRLLAAAATAQYVSAAVGAAGVNMQLQAQATDVTNQATSYYTMAVVDARAQVDAMTHTLQAGYMSMVSQAQASAQGSVALLGFSTAQQQVNYQLIGAEEQYTQASSEASAYSTALTALSGTTNNLLSSEAAFTTSLGSLTTAVSTNGKSLDVTSTQGAANITVLTGIATAADKAAAAVYQNEINTKGASQAYDDANAKLAQEERAFEAAAQKAGFNKTAVQQLAAELFKLPADITIDVDTTKAVKGIKGLLEFIDSSTGTVNVLENSVGAVLTPGGSRVQAHAGGGIAQAGQLAMFGEEGPELGVPKQDMQIFTAGQTRDILAGVGARGNVTQNFYGSLPNAEQAASLRRELAIAVGVAP